MEEIIIQQKDRPKNLTGKAFLIAAAGLVLRIALAQTAASLLLAATGEGLFRMLFYLYAVWLLVRHMRRMVEGYTYTLRQETLVLQRQLGDSAHAVVEIPLRSLRAIRPVAMGERLGLYYRKVKVIDPSAAPSLRMRIAFAASYLSSRLARKIAGEDARRVIGCVAVYEENEKLMACVFRPDEAFRAALARELPQVFGDDDRAWRDKLEKLSARALNRAFPDLYPYVRPLFDEEEAVWAKEEIARQKAEKKADKEKKAKKKAEKREIRSGWLRSDKPAANENNEENEQHEQAPRRRADRSPHKDEGRNRSKR
ncbi:MAG: hypothetical protein J6K32_10825 [Clostridia bacterium]|nr:hypothetical protein [Clostridia bacterium]